MNKKIIGIIGGMGPEATNKLCQEIIDYTHAKKDQDHIPFIVYNNPAIPDRTQAILYNGENPVPEIVRTARQLERLNVDFIVMPCNTAHYYFDEIQRQLNTPVINMIEETARSLKKKYPNVTEVGLLATSGTVKSGIYDEIFSDYKLSVSALDDRIQEHYVMEAIYGKNGIKANHEEEPRTLLKHAADKLITKGVEAIVAGCTEIPLVFNQESVSVPFIDPSKILAHAAVEKALTKDEVNQMRIVMSL